MNVYIPGDAETKRKWNTLASLKGIGLGRFISMAVESLWKEDLAAMDIFFADTGNKDCQTEKELVSE